MTIDYAATPSPCFVLEEARLRANLELLAHVQQQSGAKIILALKGFSMYGTFPLVRKYLPGVTASSLSEARLGREEHGGEVHAYCPAYIDDDFDAIAQIASHVTFNSVGQFERYRGRLAGKSAGLRINPEYAEVETDLYNPCIPGSRLGVTAAQLGGKLPEGVEGLHFHTLCEKGSDTLERTLEHVEARFGALLDQVRWLNMGGGHAITRQGYDVDKLIALVRATRARHPNLEEIVLEPGSAVGWQTGELVSTVLDIVDNGGVRTAMLDASFSAHMPDCLEMPYRPTVLGAKNDAAPDEPGHRYHLGGQTCLAGDFMPDYVFEKPLAVGDRVVFWDMIHYTMVKTTTFNGVNLPAIAVSHEDGRLEVLKTFGYEEYKARL
ncbi:MAG: carboxynorspermidine decarboxylase [Sandaracinus sp.]|nr:carboxynorspermidine decarboxylase [Sandaracinus sp.]MCB9625076.1 carboxynorspermidine decarboxylase [Sandaracinus sp.]